jgi:hypothetical protein
MPTTMKDDESANPSNILLLGAITVVPYAEGMPHLVEEARLTGHAV